MVRFLIRALSWDATLIKGGAEPNLSMKLCGAYLRKYGIYEMPKKPPKESNSQQICIIFNWYSCTHLTLIYSKCILHVKLILYAVWEIFEFSISINLQFSFSKRFVVSLWVLPLWKPQISAACNNCICLMLSTP